MTSSQSVLASRNLVLPMSRDLMSGPDLPGILTARRGPHVEARRAVEAVGVTVVYERVPVLRDIDLAIATGETVALMGPNGAGKSTLLKSLVGAVRPTTGCVRWFENPSPRRIRTRRRIGVVGEEMGLYAELTVTENLRFAGRMFGVSTVSDRVASLLVECGLKAQADRPVGQLSLGTRQRVAILRALVHEPQFLVLDEPSCNLDEEGRSWLEGLFRRWRSSGRTLCFASHDATECRTLADRIVHLEAGRIVAIEPCGCPVDELRRSA